VIKSRSEELCLLGYSVVGSIDSYPSHIPEDSTLQNHCCENLTPRCVACMNKTGTAFNILVVDLKAKRSLSRNRGRREANIKVLNKYGVRKWTGFICLSMSSNNGLYESDK
jgi:hypothetical protein